jgi:hypothetical protein
VGGVGEGAVCVGRGGRARERERENDFLSLATFFVEPNSVYGRRHEANTYVAFICLRMLVRVYVRVQILGLVCVFVYETRERGAGDGGSRFVRLQCSSVWKVGSSEAAWGELAGAAGR